MKMKNLKILLSTILIGAAFIGCSSTPDEKTVKSLATLYNIKSAKENDIKIVKSFEKDGKLVYIGHLYIKVPNATYDLKVA